MNFCCLVFYGNMPLSQVDILWKICPTARRTIFLRISKSILMMKFGEDAGHQISKKYKHFA
jgi:hypothetical protein